MQNKKGFTLVEVLVVIVLVGMLGLSAISSYMNSTRTFEFLGGYKTVMTTVRTARAYAVTSKDALTFNVEKNQWEKVLRYGVRVGNDCVTFLKITDQNIDTYLSSIEDAAKCKDKNKAIGAEQNSSLIFTGTDHTIGLGGLKEPIYMFYEIDTGEMSVYQNKDVKVEKTGKNNALKLNFSNTKDNDLSKDILILQVTGLVEELD